MAVRHIKRNKIWENGAAEFLSLPQYLEVVGFKDQVKHLPDINGLVPMLNRKYNRSLQNRKEVLELKIVLDCVCVVLDSEVAVATASDIRRRIHNCFDPVEADRPRNIPDLDARALGLGRDLDCQRNRRSTIELDHGGQANMNIVTEMGVIGLSEESLRLLFECQVFSLHLGNQPAALKPLGALPFLDLKVG